MRNRAPLLGKVPISWLERHVFSRLGHPSSDIVVGAMIGVDFAVTRVGRQYLIVSSDPITGVVDHIGWHAVNVTANDVATSGNPPQFLEVVTLLPQGSGEHALHKISSETSDAASRLGIAILGGHTEVTPGLRRPMLVTTGFTIAASYVTAADAKEGDNIIMTKTAGLEGTAILAGLRTHESLGLTSTGRKRAQNFRMSMSIVGEAKAAFSSGRTHAMHDPTEGGILGGVHEMSLASNIGFTIEEEKVPIARETRNIAHALNLDPLMLLGSGSLLIATPHRDSATIFSELKNVGISAEVIGRFHGHKRCIVHHSGKIEIIKETPQDELWRYLAGREIND